MAEPPNVCRVQLPRIGRVGYGRVPDQHHHRLAREVHAFVVVPAELRRLHAVADEHHVRSIEAHRLDHPLGPRDEIGFERQRLPRRALLERQDGGRVWRDADERDGLDVRAVGRSRPKPHRPELLDQVRDGPLLAARGRRPSLELVGRQHRGVPEHGRRVNRGKRHAGRPDRSQREQHERGERRDDDPRRKEDHQPGRTHRTLPPVAPRRRPATYFIIASRVALNSVPAFHCGNVPVCARR